MRKIFFIFFVFLLAQNLFAQDKETTNIQQDSTLINAIIKKAKLTEEEHEFLLKNEKAEIEELPEEQRKFAKKIEEKMVNAAMVFLAVVFEYPMDSALCNSSTAKFKTEPFDAGKIAGYPSISLTKKNIGKQFTLDNKKVDVVSILDNKVVLKGDYENINLINFVSGKKIAASFGGAENFLPVSGTISKSNYENICVKKMNFEEYLEMITEEKLKEMETEERYKILISPAEIGNKFILYIKE